MHAMRSLTEEKNGAYEEGRTDTVKKVLLDKKRSSERTRLKDMREKHAQANAYKRRKP